MSSPACANGPLLQAGPSLIAACALHLVGTPPLQSVGIKRPTLEVLCKSVEC